MGQRGVLASFKRSFATTTLRTIYSPTPEALDKHLSESPVAKSSKSFYLLSTSLAPSSLEPLLAVLQSRLPSAIGSFSASVPGREPSISLATFDDHVTVFRSQLTGRKPAEVGRWQRPGHQTTEEDRRGSRIADDEVLMKEGWNGLWDPSEVDHHIPELEGVDAQSFLLLSDNNPRPVLRALKTMFPATRTAGILTAPTPFLTGRPHTLIHDGRFYSSGTLGLAFSRRLPMTIDFGLDALSEKFRVKRAQGNLLLQIEGDSQHSNPAQALVTALQNRSQGSKLNKDEEYFLSIGSGPDMSVVKVLSGDPSKGLVSLDTEESLREGEEIQFLHRTRERNMGGPWRNELNFSVVAKLNELENVSSGGKTSTVEGFEGLSEEGLVFGHSICAVPGARVSSHIP